MQYRHVGACGLKVSAFSLGAGNFGTHCDEKTALEVMAAAFDIGINSFDSAESYGKNGSAEEIMGRALRQLGWPRLKYVVSTKFYWGLEDGPNQRNTLNRKYLLGSIDASLDRLQLEYVDLIYCHRADPNTSIEETVWAMHQIIADGKALYWGTSNWTAEQIRSAWGIAERHHLHKPVVEQPQYNLLHRKTVQREYPRLCADIGLGLISYSPLAGGLLSGLYRVGIPAGSRAALIPWMAASIPGKRRELANQLEALAQQLGWSLMHMSLAWCLCNPNVCSAILGVSKASEVIENVKALELLPKLTPALIERIEAVVGDYSVGWTPKSAL